MQELWLDTCFDAFDKGRQTLDLVLLTTTESVGYIYKVTRDVWNEALRIQNINEYLEQFHLGKIIKNIGGGKKVVAADYSKHGSVFDRLTGVFSGRVFKVGVHLTALSLLVYATSKYCIKKLPKQIKGNKEVILVIGDMSDAISRSVVYELNSKGFIVFVCAAKDSEEKCIGGEYEKIPDPWDKEDGVFHIGSSKSSLSCFIEYLKNDTRHLRGIIIIPNVSFYSSGSYLNVSVKYVNSEFNSNFLNIWDILVKVLPEFMEDCRDKLQIIVVNPSLCKNLNIPYHCLETTVSFMMENFYRLLKNESSHFANVYQCHLGVLSVAGNTSNYKYLNIDGSSILTSLCNPIYELLICNNYIWYRFKRWLMGSVIFCGKGALRAYFLRSWTPIWFLELL